MAILPAACYEPKEGCLDTAAVNFDASADENCCCRYPQLTLRLAPLYNGDTWLPDSAYQTPEGQWFRLKSFIFYLSELRLSKSGQLFSVTDTLQLKAFNPAGNDTLPLILTDDVQLFRWPNVDLTIGDFSATGVFDTVRIRFGLGADARRVVPASAPAGHPLRQQPENLWVDRNSGYVFAQMVLSRDTAAATTPDTLRFTAAEAGNLFFRSGTPLTQAGGSNLQINMRIDYEELFRGVDLSSTGPNAWKSKIIANLPKAFVVNP